MSGGGRCTQPRDWWVSAFDELYPALYAHREEREAERLVASIEKSWSLGNGPVLDLGCGTGRHLQAMVGRGVPGVGLDYSWPLLSRARALAGHVALVRGDMRLPPFRRRSFGWVLMVFTTFGYFPDDEENLRVLREVAALLGPGGRFVLDQLNAPVLRATLVERSVRLIPGYRVEERRWIDEAGPFVRKETRLVPTAGAETRVYRERVRLYEPREIEELLGLVGLAIEAQMGDYDGRPFDGSSSPRLVVVASARGEPL